jgi:hypothetical protein
MTYLRHSLAVFIVLSGVLSSRDHRGRARRALGAGAVDQQFPAAALENNNNVAFGSLALSLARCAGAATPFANASAGSTRRALRLSRLELGPSL